MSLESNSTSSSVFGSCSTLTVRIVRSAGSSYLSITLWKNLYSPLLLLTGIWVVPCLSALINRNVSCVPAVPPLACPEPFCGYCYLTSPLSHLLNMTSTGPPWVDHSLATASTAFVGLSRYIRPSIPLLP